MLKPGLPGFSPARLLELFAPIAARKKIALAVSGGPDSLGLMVLVNHWLKSQDLRPEVFVYSLNHGLRAEARDECEMVGEVARNMGFSFRELIWDGKKPVSGIQAAARAARYRLIAQAMHKDNVTILLTGHHMNDQAETVLMRLSAGSGLYGLRGMEVLSQLEGIEVFRPLLDVAPKEMTHLLSHVGLRGVDDPSNYDEKYERVRWRRALLRLDELGLGSNRLLKFSRRMGRANQALEQMCDDLFARHVSIDQFGVFYMAQKDFFSQPEEMAIRLLSRMIFAANGGRGEGELAQLEKLVPALAEQNFATCTIANCIIAKRDDLIFAAREAGRVEGGEVLVRAGETIVWDQRFRVTNKSKKSLRIKAGAEYSRREFLRDFAGDMPMNSLGIGAAPLLRDMENKVLGIGEITLSDLVQCRLVFSG